MTDNRVCVEVKANVSNFVEGFKQAKQEVKRFEHDLKAVSNVAPSLINPFMTLGPLGLKVTEAAERAFKILHSDTGATGEVFEDLKKNLNNLWGTVPAAARTIAIALADLHTSLGLTGDALERAGRSSLALSCLLGVDVAKSVQGSSSVVQAFHINANDASRVMNDLFATCQSAGIGFTDLTTVLQASAGALQSFGLNAGQSMGFVGRLSKAGMQADQITTALVNAQSYLLDNGEGIDSLQELLTRVTTVADGVDVACKAFGPEAAEMMSETLKTIGDDLSGLGQKLANTRNLLEDFATEQFCGQILNRSGKGTMLAEISQQCMDVIDKLKQVLEKNSAVSGSANKTDDPEGTNNASAPLDGLIDNLQKWKQDLQTGIIDAIVDGQNLADTFKSVGKEMEKLILQYILFGTGKNGGGLLGGLFQGLFGSGEDGGLLGGLFKGLFGGLAKQAKGGAWDGGVQFFARGGIVNSLTAFAHAHGLGVMGEAGPEAILPLRRGPNGQLGVQAIGGSRGSGGVAVNVTVNNQGGGSMSREQAQALGEQLTGVIDARVAQILYEQERRRVY